MLQIYNTLSKQKTVFKPRVAGKVGIYVCGMTVYDFCHIGHARMLAAFDMITRYLRFSGYDVTYVRNITDIDDKIIHRAQQNNETYQQLTARFIQAYKEDAAALNILPPDQEPCATEHIAEIIHLVKILLEKNIAYVGKNGDIFYAVEKFAKYGALSHRDLADMQAGARVEVDTAKHNPMDFVLWKMAKADEPAWDSPWGKGRPGWHIECSAMSMKCLGEQFDIHGGGFDLTFPHHENEIAQSEAATGKTFVNTWMHVGFVQINDEKMSKSLNNFFTIRDVLKEYSNEVVRYFLLASHYRSPINYSEASLVAVQNSLQRFYTALRGVPIKEDIALDAALKQRFMAVMDDDFNTPEALAILFELSHDINRFKVDDMDKAIYLAAQLRQLGAVFGLLQQDPNEFLQAGAEHLDVAEIEALIALRRQARAEKNWQEADRIRAQLTAKGIELEDAADKTLWKKL